MKRQLISMAGWYGVFAILLAYALVSFGVIVARSYTYQLLNLSGAIGIIVSSLAKKDHQPVVLNVVWSVVALVALVQIIAT